MFIYHYLRATDQTFIQQILNHFTNAKYNTNIIIIHNFMDIETVEDADSVIKIEVQDMLEATLDKIEPWINNQSRKIVFFHSEHREINLRHSAFAKAGSNGEKM